MGWCRGCTAPVDKANAVLGMYKWRHDICLCVRFEVEIGPERKNLDYGRSKWQKDLGAQAHKINILKACKDEGKVLLFMRPTKVSTSSPLHPYNLSI